MLQRMTMTEAGADELSVGYYSQPAPADHTTPALLHAIASMACDWLCLAGCSVDMWRGLGAAQVAASPRPGLLAAALDLLRLLDSTPQGRQAIAQLVGQDFFQQAKGE
jgi:hypothetical protein